MHTIKERLLLGFGFACALLLGWLLLWKENRNVFFRMIVNCEKSIYRVFATLWIECYSHKMKHKKKITLKNGCVDTDWEWTPQNTAINTLKAIDQMDPLAVVK